MLKQLSQLTTDADGRFATSEELDFIRDYISSAKKRVEAYKKIREMRSDILFDTEQELLKIDKDMFVCNGKDFKTVFHRDQGIELKYTAATILSGDIERLKQSLLLWYRTIIGTAKPSKCRKVTGLTYQVKPKVILSKLNEEEQSYVKPILSVNKAVLGYF